MTGETDLEILLKSLKPLLHRDEFVWASVSEAEASQLEFKPHYSFVEHEGVTVICRKSEAEDARLDYIFPCKMITLNVHSSLEAVGLTAAVSRKLADAGISANVVAAYYHDHVFVPTERADEAVSLLSEFSRE